MMAVPPSILAVDWIAPVAGAVIAASTIPPLLALYFLRLRRSRRVVAATMHWRRAAEDVRANAPFQRLRLSLLLLLQLLALGLVALAIAQPQVDLGLGGAEKIALLIDRSGSMGALDGGAERGTRLADAKRRAVDRVRALHGGGLFAGPAPSIMVIAFASEATVLCPFTDSSAQAIAAIESIEATDELSAIGGGVELARSFAASGGEDGTASSSVPAVLEVYSDGRIGDLDGLSLRDGERVIFHRIGGEDSPNVGIGAIAVTRMPESPGEVRVFARVVSWSKSPTKTDLELRVDGRLVAVTPSPVELGAAMQDAATGALLPAQTQAVFPGVQVPAGAVVEVRVTADDLLPADNAARVVAPRLGGLKIALVGRGSFVLRSVIQGLSPASFETLTPEEWNKRVAKDPLTPDAFDVVVLEQVTPQSMARGRYLIFGSAPTGTSIIPFGTKEQVVPRSIRSEHPLMQYVNLDDLFVASMAAVAPGSDSDVVVEASEGPMILTLSRGPLTLVYVSFDPIDTEWPFQRSFVNFTANALAWLAAGGLPAADEPLSPGAVAAGRLPAGAQSPSVRVSSGMTAPLSLLEGGRFTLGPLRRAGTATIAWQGGSQSAAPTSLAYAVNMDCQAEGRLDAADQLQLATNSVVAQPSRAASQSVWPWLLLAAALVLLLEWWVWLRRT